MRCQEAPYFSAQEASPRPRLRGNRHSDPGYAGPMLRRLFYETWAPQLLEGPIVDWPHYRLLGNPRQVGSLQYIGSRKVRLVCFQPIHPLMIAQVLM